MTEIDATGALVTPGWVDVHTHYDGQVSWDPELAPSSHHGVTTVIMGNCGVGFAPVRPGSEGFLIELMEGVEDIPGTALHEGIDWTWETYGEYLDALEAMPRTIDVGGQLPHAAVRAYVLGDRAHEYDVTPAEIAEMAQITRDALDAGAFGFSTSRTFLHTSKHGLVPGTHSTPDEVIAIAEAVRDSGHGLFQYVSDDLGQGGDEDWLDSLKEMGCPTTYTLAQTPRMPEAFRTALDGGGRDHGNQGTTHPAGRRSARPGCCSVCRVRSTRSSPTRASASTGATRSRRRWRCCGSGVRRAVARRGAAHEGPVRDVHGDGVASDVSPG